MPGQGLEGMPTKQTCFGRNGKVEKARITSHPSEVPIFDAPGALGNQGGGAWKMTRYMWGQ